MFIDKIDGLLESTINDFFKKINKDDNIIKITSDINFSKYQKEINKIMSDFIKSIDRKEIEKVINSKAVNNIIEIIKRYIAIYMFLFIGYNYTGKTDIFINNIIEFSKNSSNYDFKIENFFNSENNALVIRMFLIIKSIQTLIEIDKSKSQSLLNKAEFNDANNILETLGNEYIEKFLKVKNKNDKAHNIIKTVIIIDLYKKTEKKDIFRILEIIENESGDYMFIDIVVPSNRRLDFSLLENSLTHRELKLGMANDIWNYVIENSNKKTDFDIDKNINLLLSSGLVIPIVDDFLLYHKGSEKYEISSKLQEKKKEDTKIRYIVSKIEETSNLYNEKEKSDNIVKNFYIPLNDRKAILVNNSEDVNIISKFINQGQKVMDNNEYFHDFVNYRIYPYINFKEFEKDGFSFVTDRTLDAIRAVSITDSGIFKQFHNNIIQTRVCAKDMIVNIIGLVIPSNTTHLYCTKVHDSIDVRLASKKNKNAYSLTLALLNDILLSKKKRKVNTVWLFDTQKDEFVSKSYEYTEKITKQEQIKQMMNTYYEDILNIIYSKITNKLENTKNLTIQNAFNIVKNIQKYTMKIPQNSDLYFDIENILYNTVIQIKEINDIREDIFYGIYGDIIKLPDVEEEINKRNRQLKIDNHIDIHHSESLFKSEEKEYIDATCQHMIMQDEIIKFKRKDPNKYTDMVYEFFDTFVVENLQHEYVCKSCGIFVQIKKYISEGKFDNDTNSFVKLGQIQNIPLDEIKEYEKIRIAIRYMDKIIERIATLCNISIYTGIFKESISKRRNTLKDIIDLIQINNRHLKINFKERVENANKKYGVGKELTELFFFELENQIFQVSSKEKDYKKLIKHNNVLSYTIIMILLELSASHISMMKGDKKSFCSYDSFDKVWVSIFDKLMIRKNLDGDIVPISNYKVLCYVLFFMSCMMSKYNMWYKVNSDDTTKKYKQEKSFNPHIQKIIIHTTIDILNNIIENGKKDISKRIYDSTIKKYFFQLQTTFSNESILDQFSEKQKTSTLVEGKTHILIKAEPHKLSGNYAQEFQSVFYKKCTQSKFELERTEYITPLYSNINSVTNCPTGEFHNWEIISGTASCIICKQKLADIKMYESDEITKNYIYMNFRELAKRYCISGEVHNFVFNNEKKISICIKCNKSENFEYSKKELDQLVNNLKKITTDKDIQIVPVVEDKKDFDKILKQYDSELIKKNKYAYIDELISNFITILGKSSFNNLFLKDNIYIIDHDHSGFVIDKPIIVSEKENKIILKKNHSFFKKDIITFSNYKVSKIDVFYDAKTLTLIGYKDGGKDYFIHKSSEKKLKISYSIYTKLVLLGYESKVIDISDKITELSEIYNDIDLIKQEALIDVIRDRINNLKQTINEFQRLIYRLKFNISKNISDKSSVTKSDTTPQFKIDKSKQPYSDTNGGDDSIIQNRLVDLGVKYSNKLNQININENDKSIFINSKNIIDNVFVSKIDYGLNINKTVDVEDISSVDINGSSLLFHITNVMNKLILVNNNKIIKTYIVEFLIEFIDIMFEFFNIEQIVTIPQNKKFIYTLKSSSYLQNIETEFKEDKSDEYDEDSEEREKQIDDEEERDALDIDIDPEDQEDGDAGVNYETSFERYKPNNV